MPTLDKAQSLANIIAEERAGEVEKEFYVEVTKKTFDKWFVNTNKGNKPYLDMFKHGGRVVSGRYMMLNRKKVTYRKTKSGNFLPYKKEAREQASLANKLMFMAFNGKVIKTKTQDGVEIRIGYSDKLPSEYKGFYVDWAGEETEAPRSVMKSGKMSSLDKLLVRSIKKWADEEGLKVNISSYYEE